MQHFSFKLECCKGIELDRKREFKSGFVTILGRPNVGKSTLLNALIGNKISIISPIPQTTRHQIKGILNLKNAQIVLVDTPGIHSFKDNLTRQLNALARQSIAGCDLILYVVDVSRNIGREEQEVMRFLLEQEIKIIMVLNKMDLGGKFLTAHIDAWKMMMQNKETEKKPLLYFLPLSALKGKNMDELRDLIIENLPHQPAFYEPGTVTDFPLKFRIADALREKLFLNLKKELPHSLAVEIEEIEDKESICIVNAFIYVNRISQRKIIIGKGGTLLKEIGIASRLDIEKILGKKVYLQIVVKVMPDWQERPRILQKLGYWVA